MEHGTMVQAQRYHITYRICLYATLLFVGIGCSTTVSPEDRNRIAETYSDVLIARRLYPADSLRTLKAIDSATRNHGYDGLEDFTTDFEELTRIPDQFREMLDSTHKRLERVRDSSPSLPGSGTAEPLKDTSTTNDLNKLLKPKDDTPQKAKK